MRVGLKPVFAAFLLVLFVQPSLSAGKADLGCKITGIDLGFDVIKPPVVGIYQTVGALEVLCHNLAETGQRVALNIFDSVVGPHALAAENIEDKVELIIYSDSGRVRMIAATAARESRRYVYIDAGRQVQIKIPIYPEIKVPKGVIDSFFTYPMTLRVIVEKE